MDGQRVERRHKTGLARLHVVNLDYNLLRITEYPSDRSISRVCIRSGTPTCIATLHEVDESQFRIPLTGPGAPIRLLHEDHGHWRILAGKALEQLQ